MLTDPDKPQASDADACDAEPSDVEPSDIDVFHSDVHDRDCDNREENAAEDVNKSAINVDMVVLEDAPAENTGPNVSRRLHVCKKISALYITAAIICTHTMCIKSAIDVISLSVCVTSYVHTTRKHNTDRHYQAIKKRSVNPRGLKYPLRGLVMYSNPPKDLPHFSYNVFTNCAI